MNTLQKMITIMTALSELMKMIIFGTITLVSLRVFNIIFHFDLLTFLNNFNGFFGLP